MSTRALSFLNRSSPLPLVIPAGPVQAESGIRADFIADITFYGKSAVAVVIKVGVGTYVPMTGLLHFRLVGNWWMGQPKLAALRHHGCEDDSVRLRECGVGESITRAICDELNGWHKVQLKRRRNRAAKPTKKKLNCS